MNAYERRRLIFIHGMCRGGLASLIPLAITATATLVMALRYVAGLAAVDMAEPLSMEVLGYTLIVSLTWATAGTGWRTWKSLENYRPKSVASDTFRSSVDAEVAHLSAKQLCQSLPKTAMPNRNAQARL